MSGLLLSGSYKGVIFLSNAVLILQYQRGARDPLPL